MKYIVLHAIPFYNNNRPKLVILPVSDGFDNSCVTLLVLIPTFVFDIFVCRPLVQCVIIAQ